MIAPVVGIRRASVWALFILLSLAAPVKSVRGEATLGLNFFAQFNTYQNQPAFNGYVAFPDLQSLPDARTTRTEVHSPTDAFSSGLDAGQNTGGGGSGVFTDFTDYKSAIHGPGWILRIDADTPTPTDYTFAIDASAMTEFGAVPAVIAAGTQGASFAEASTPTFDWTGPAGFDTVSFSLSGPVTEDISLAAATTSHTVSGPLAAGDYQLDITYYKDLTATPPIIVSTPLNAGNPFADWGGLTQFQETVSDRVTFSVVPEPASFALLACGGVLLVASARRRFRLS